MAVGVCGPLQWRNRPRFSRGSLTSDCHEWAEPPPTFKEHGLDTSDGVGRQEKLFAPTAFRAHPGTAVLESRLQMVERTDRPGLLNAGRQMKRPRALGGQCQIEPLHSSATNHLSDPGSQVLD